MQLNAIGRHLYQFKANCSVNLGAGAISVTAWRAEEGFPGQEAANGEKRRRKKIAKSLPRQSIGGQTRGGSGLRFVRGAQFARRASFGR